MVESGEVKIHIPIASQTIYMSTWQWTALQTPCKNNPLHPAAIYSHISQVHG